MLDKNKERMINYYSNASLLFIVLSCLLLLSCGKSERGGNLLEMSKLVPDQLGNLKTAGDLQNYDRQTIFDYIDGAGEVYLMYDFRSVVVKKLADPDSTVITVELFDMGRPDDAFGIFSHSREGNDIGIGGGSEFRDGYLCFWKDRYFACVYSDAAGSELNDTIINLGHAISLNIDGITVKPELLNLLPSEGMRESSEIYFHLQTSLNYHYFLAEENILGLDKSTDAVLALYDPGRFTLLCVRYPRVKDAKNAFDNFKNDYIPEGAIDKAIETEQGKWVLARNHDRYLAISFDAPDSSIANTVVSELIERISRMGNER